MTGSRHLLTAAALTVLAVLSTQTLIAGERAPETRAQRLQGGFGSTASERDATAVPPALQKSPLGSIARGTGASSSPILISNLPCPVRDPEDGACYASADAADRSWLARGPVNPSQLEATLAQTDEVIDEDPDEGLDVADASAADDADAEDTEDGGSLAPVDAPHAAPRAQGKRGFWREIGHRLSRFVVRKADSRPASIPEEELEALFTADFPMPIKGYPEWKIRDSFDAPRGKHRRHHAIDLPADSGTPIIAVVDGVIERIGRDRRGGKVVYLRDSSGRFTFYYAHLSRHEKGLRAGDTVRKGQRLGYVGSTGSSTGPHLHFAIFRQDGEPRPNRGFVLNPYLVFTSLGR